MITVGVKVRGETALKPIAGIELKFCPTYKALEKYEIKLLENVKKDELDKVKKLTGQVYSIGAVDSDIKLVTLPITSLDEILGEKYAIQQEKQRSIEAIRQTTEEKVQLEKQVESQTSNIKELREKIAELRQKIEQKDLKIADLENQVKTTSEKLGAEASLRQRAEREAKAFSDQLAVSISEGETNLEAQKAHLTSIQSQEIAKIQGIIKEKEDRIKEKEEEIEDLKQLNEELSKSGSIPDIPYKYEGQASIIGFCSHGSYGVSNILYTVNSILSSNYNILMVDLDLRGGHLKDLIGSDNIAIENILKGGSVLKEHLLANSTRQVDFIGGVIQQWNVYDIINLPYEEIFAGNYDFILCDLGIYGGYNIQTKLTDMIRNNGHIVNIFTKEDKKIETDINVRNFSNNQVGIPFISRILANGISLNDDKLAKQYIHELVVNPILEITNHN